VLAAARLGAVGLPVPALPVPALSGAGEPRNWTMQNQASPITVITSATKKFSRRPRKWAEESIRMVSSKIRYPEYPATYSANRPCGRIGR
jgi:hypothetical protein